MLFLPIVDRELRVASRRSRSYWERIVFAALAILVSFIILYIQIDSPWQMTGQWVFIGLAIISMLYCVFSGRLSTADCMSEEKREGTLGLLFLTDLKGYDVVLGKLVAASLGSFYGLIAILPVLAVPLVMGGITNGEFLRVAVVLVNTFLFSLAIGIFGSVCSRDTRGAFAANLLWGIGLFLLLPLCSEGIVFLATNQWTAEGWATSPFYALWMCADTRYGTAQFYFWISVGVIHFLTWGLLILACRIAPRNWQEPARARPAKQSRAEFWRKLSYGRPELLAAHRKTLLDTNAFYWLAARARCKPTHVWIFLGLAVLWCFWTSWNASARFAMDSMVAFSFLCIVNTTLKCWITVEACQQLAEDRRSGALELLFSTPLTEHDIVRGQLQALRRQFLRPVVAAIGFEVLLMAMVFRHFRDPELEMWAGYAFMLVADMITLSLVGMKCAITSKSPHQATGRAIGLVLVMPWIGFGIAIALITIWAVFFSASGMVPAWVTHFRLWFVIGITFDLFQGLSAWNALTRRFRTLALPQFAATLPPPPKKVEVKPAATTQSKPVRPSTFKKRRAAASVLFAILIASLAFLWQSCRSTVPPVVSVTLTDSNAPLRVFNVNTRIALILPDGSLWGWGWSPRSNRPPSDVPQRFGNQIAWKQIALGSYRGVHAAGLSSDGRIWDLSSPIEPVPLDASNDWAGLALGVNHGVALKKNGTVWVWGQNESGQLGIPQHPPFTTLSQLGTNSDWASVGVTGYVSMGIQSNGTLWVWGPFGTNRCQPELFCTETNWAGFHPGWRPWPVTHSGECWNMSPTRRSESPIVPSVDAISVLMLTNYRPNRFATAFGLTNKIYEVRDDGTLWSASWTNTFRAPVADWTQVGTRADWVAIWGSHIAVGLTADGTIWTWGVDATRTERIPFKHRLTVFQHRVSATLTGSSPPNDDLDPLPVFQPEPRPLMRMKTAGTGGK